MYFQHCYTLRQVLVMQNCLQGGQARRSITSRMIKNVDSAGLVDILGFKATLVDGFLA